MRQVELDIAKGQYDYKRNCAWIESFQLVEVEKKYLTKILNISFNKL